MTQMEMEVIQREPKIEYSMFDVTLDSIKRVSMTFPLNLVIDENEKDVWDDDDSNAVTRDEKTAKPIFHPRRMIEGKYYPFTFKNKEYLIKKSGKNTINVYEIEEDANEQKSHLTDKS